MKIKVLQGDMRYLKDCQEALLNSQIGEVYFVKKDRVEVILREGLAKGEIFVAVDEVEQCLGYIWFSLSGMFYSFPYVRNLMVKHEYRGMGVGGVLLDYFETVAFSNARKVFLTVSDFNLQAKKFYEEHGYQQVGLVPSLVIEGIGECVMMKVKNS